MDAGGRATQEQLPTTASMQSSVATRTDLCAARIPLRGTSLRLSCALRAGRPKKSAHDAVDDIANALWAGHTQVIDADLSKYFDSIPHAKLMAVVAERVVDGGVLRLIQMWLKAAVLALMSGICQYSAFSAQ